MSDIIKVILQIDRQHNGYVTVTELDDILKLTYPEDLKNKDTKPLMRKYASIQNRVLVDYKKFRESILDQVNLLLESRQRTHKQRLNLLQKKHQMQFNETLSNYLKTRTEQYERKLAKRDSIEALRDNQIQTKEMTTERASNSRNAVRQ